MVRNFVVQQCYSVSYESVIAGVEKVFSSKVGKEHVSMEAEMIATLATWIISLAGKVL